MKYRMGIGIESSIIGRPVINQQLFSACFNLLGIRMPCPLALFPPFLPSPSQDKKEEKRRGQPDKEEPLASMLLNGP
jgi:hypothetical protein